MSENKEEIRESIPEQTAVETPSKKHAKNREPFFGTLLLGFFILLILVSLAGAGFGGYRLWQEEASEKRAPSVSDLENLTLADPQKSPTEISQTTPEQTTASTSSDTLTKAQATEVSVMNGGGPRGVAGEAGTLLKTAGFTKVTVGNTTGNFTGTTVYYMRGLENEAKAVQEKLITKYPKVVLKPAEDANLETKTKPLTVIFGQ